jgi:hypothetical protein
MPGAAPPGTDPAMPYHGDVRPGPPSAGLGDCVPRALARRSAFVALVDIFLVSIVALTGGSAVFGLSSLAMATVGLLATRRLIPRAKRLEISPATFEPEG